MKAKKSHYLGSPIFREVNFPGKSNFTKHVNFPGKSNFIKDVHEVHISAIYDTQLRLIRQVMKYAEMDARTDGE